MKEINKIGEEYVEARIIESLSDLLLALALWKEGYTRNSAGKAFSAVKALLSAFVVLTRTNWLTWPRTTRRRSGLKRRHT